MNLLVNGGSLSRGPGSWPYVLQQAFDCDMVNLSQSGCGNTYLHETTISELAQRNYDLVIVQWTPFIRFDYKVRDIGQFWDTKFTSHYQSMQNDWPDKIVNPVNDQDYVEKDWIFGCGYSVNSEKNNALGQAFEDFYTFAGPAEYMYHALIKIISLQSFLQAHSIPYLFCFGREFKLLPRYRHLNQLLDYSKMFTECYLYDMAQQNNWWGPDGIHPNDVAYQRYAELLIPKIKTLYDFDTQY
jgi:hypothetical protein